VSGYRFCRTDDVPLLVAAYNRCYAAHVEGAAPLTVEEFKRGVRELDLWASSCMVALSDTEPIGVLLAAKRERETLIHRIGVHPQHRRQGHGRHLLESLGRKLAILGPPRLVAEIPERWPDALRFFERCGYRREGSFADFRCDSPRRPTEAAALAVTLDELVDGGAWDEGIRRSWERSLQTVRNRGEQLEGLAVASDERIEAWVLSRRRDTDSRELVGLGSARGERGRAVLGILVAQLCGREASAVVVPRISPEEVPYDLLEAWGFERTAAYVAYAAEAAS
jgi:GNAT superfamily N-acetyltransferase